MDDALRREVGSPWTELSLPWSALADMKIEGVEVVVVENKVNLLTLSPRARSLGLGGLGRAAVELRRVPWLRTSSIAYWGDLDVEGFQILSDVRQELPQTRSVLMDVSALERFRHLAVPGTGARPESPLRLTDDERRAFLICREENLRIEQERLPSDAWT